MASSSSRGRRSSSRGRSRPASPGIGVEEIVAGAFVLIALLLGGASAGGFLANAMIQLASALLIAWALTTREWHRDQRAERFPLVLALVLLGYMLIQLVPLPPAVWTMLPGRESLVDGFTAIGLSTLPWMPVSLVPTGTWSGVTAMLPPIAALVVGIWFGRRAVQIAIWALLVAALASVLVGLGQLSGGVGSPLYFYNPTNYGSAVGFFSNSNHQATLMLIVLPLAAGVGALARIDGDETGAATVAWIAVPAVALLSLLGLLAAGSLAGVLLAPIALAGAYLIFGKSLPRRARLWFLAAGGAVVAVAVVIVLLSPAISDFGATSLGTGGMSRGHMWPIAGSAVAAAGLPFGSGFGSFAPVFRQFEDPALVGAVHANHAHSDLIEFLLEGGVASAILLVLFLGWYVARTWTIWLRSSPRDPLNCAASVAVGLVLLHSLVDYPLRTAAIAVPFAFCCALMARRPRSATANIAAETPSGTGRHLSV